MEQPRIEKEEIAPRNVEETVKFFMDGDLDEEGVIDYLRNNRDDITEFCLQVYESYQDGDKSGVIKISMILDKALE